MVLRKLFRSQNILLRCYWTPPKFTAADLKRPLFNSLREMKERPVRNERTDFFSDFYDLYVQCRKEGVPNTMDIFSKEEKTNFLQEIHKQIRKFDRCLWETRFYPETLGWGRETRSGVEFFKEDVIDANPQLQNEWNYFIRGEGLSELTCSLCWMHKTTSYWIYDDADCTSGFNICDVGSCETEIVPVSHTWWEHEFIYARKRLKNHLVPELAFEEYSKKMDDLFKQYKNNPDSFIGARFLQVYDTYSMACKKVSIQPFTNCYVRLDKIFPIVSQLNSMIRFAVLSGTKEVELRSTYNGIKALENELMVHSQSTFEIWRAFREGDGFRLLEDTLKIEPTNRLPPFTPISSTSVSNNHWWRDTDDFRKHCSNPTNHNEKPLWNFRPASVLGFDCFLTALHEVEIPHGKYSTAVDFLTNYCLFSQEARMFTEDPLNFLSKWEVYETRRMLIPILASFPSLMSKALQTGQSLRTFRTACSGYQFLKEDLSKKDITIPSLTDEQSGMNSVLAVIEEPEKIPPHEYKFDNHYDYRNIPDSHFWWPAELLEVDRKKHGNARWGGIGQT